MILKGDFFFFFGVNFLKLVVVLPSTDLNIVDVFPSTVLVILTDDHMYLICG